MCDLLAQFEPKNTSTLSSNHIPTAPEAVPRFFTTLDSYVVLCYLTLTPRDENPAMRFVLFLFFFTAWTLYRDTMLSRLHRKCNVYNLLRSTQITDTQPTCEILTIKTIMKQLTALAWLYLSRKVCLTLPPYTPP